MITHSLICVVLAIVSYVGSGALGHSEPPMQVPAGPDFSSDQAGFSIQKPHPSWTLVTKPGPYGIGELTMGPSTRVGKVQLSIQVSAATILDKSELRDHLAARLDELQDLPGFKNSKLREFTIAELEAPGFEVEQESKGVTYLVRQAFLVSEGLLYKFQFHAPQAEYDKFEGHFGSALASFKLMPLAPKARAALQLPALASRCGSEIEWLEEWDLAAERAKEEGKWIIVTVQSVSGFQVGDQIGRGPFMDRDVVRLVNERYVVLRWRKGMGAPFERQEVFGMGPGTFGSGLLVVNSKGEVQRQAFVLKASAVYDVLIAALADQQGTNQLPVPEGFTGLRAVEYLLHCGELDRAGELLASSGTDKQPIQESVLKVELHRLRRDGVRALAEVQVALDSLGESPHERSDLRAELLMLRAGLLTSTGRPEAAERIVSTLLQDDFNLNVETRSSALFLLGSLRYQAKDMAGTEATWQRLVDEYPDSPWAWMAAASMIGPAWGIAIYPTLEWPKAEHSRLIHLPDLAKNNSRKFTIDRMIEGAADYLIASQQGTGNWISPRVYGNSSKLAGELELAATAIGGRALLPLSNREDAQAAVSKALEWMFAWRALLEQQDTPPVVFMDMAVWSRSYSLLFLADCLAVGIGEEDAVRELLLKYQADLLERQQPNGGWSYYLSGTAGGAAVPQSISFTTATVVMALQRASEVGCGAEGDAISRGLDCLEAMRSPHGTFGYFLRGRTVATGQRTADGVEASAARGPACALALLRGQRESVHDMEKRMLLYVEHLAAFGAQRRKALMHAGLHTQGSHYLLYDYDTAAEALREVSTMGASAASGRRLRSALLNELRACRNQDGSFLDNPLLGADLGTGLGLSCLLKLRG